MNYAKHFGFHHLPPQLQVVSEPFANLSALIIENLPDGYQRTVCLQKLLEAKDAAVRAAIDGGVPSTRPVAGAEEQMAQQGYRRIDPKSIGEKA